jgi:hypothetical protein
VIRIVRGEGDDIIDETVYRDDDGGGEGGRSWM